MDLHSKQQQEGTENIANLDLCARLEVIRDHALIKILNYILYIAFVIIPTPFDPS
jgi:hypothetical protein